MFHHPAALPFEKAEEVVVGPLGSPCGLSSYAENDILTPMIEPLYSHIYLSPHLDDAVLSCGGTIYSQVQSGESVLVVTFFAGSPANDSLTDHARELKERWGNASDPVSVRRREDMAALDILGAKGMHLPFLDCVYRQDERSHRSYYSAKEDIFGPVHSAEAQWHHVLLASFLARVDELDQATLYAPLAAGHHVDHLLVRRMAQLLRQHQPGRRQHVLFYEDYPYAGDTLTVRAALEPCSPSCCSIHPFSFDEAALRAKGDAVACYASQISTFWSSDDEMRRALRSYATARGYALCVGAASYMENFWTLAADCAPNYRSTN